MNDTLITPSEQDMLAAELALGLLDGDERAQALRLRLTSAPFAADVDRWELHFAALLNRIEPVAPPERLKEQIRALLTSESTSNVSALRASPAVRRWQGFTALAGLVAASLALAIVVRPDGPTKVDAPVAAEEQLFARLSGEIASLSIDARYAAGSSELTVRTAGIDMSDKRPELWVVPADGKPRSLGLIPVNQSGSVSFRPEIGQYLLDGALLAVTFENPKGAPHQAPTLPIVATGKLAEI